MKYYVTSDIHGFYTPLIKALTDAEYFEDQKPHKLVILGDLFDRLFPQVGKGKTL